MKLIFQQLIFFKKQISTSILLYLFPVLLFAQTRTIKGIVSDESGKPLFGASVMIKNESGGVSTNEAGMFTLKINKNNTLVISILNYESQEVLVGNQENITIKLKSKDAILSEVVVVGYGTQKKTNITGSVATVKMDDVLGDRPVSSTGALLQGTVPGLQVIVNSGQPGAGTSLNIRGGTGFGTSATSSINTGSPFILLDNVPFNGPLNMIDPNDIETITVLKDAGSAAIYGARSAFGVILITTKHGTKNQKAQFNYSNNLVIADPTDLPLKATPMQQVQAWMDGGMTPSYNGNQNFVTWMELLNSYKTNPLLFPGGYSVTNNVYYQLAPTDAVKALLGNSSFQQMQNLSVSGGSDKTTYRISFGTTNEMGILVPEANMDNYKRYNIKSFISSDVSSWLNLQLDAGYNSSNSTTPFYGTPFSDATNLPSALALDSIPTIPGGIIQTAKSSILASAPSTSRNDNIRMTGRAILKPMKGLSITTEYTIDNLRNLSTLYDKRTGNFINPYTYVTLYQGQDRFTKSNGMTDYQAINLFATYLKSLGQHNFNLTAGMNQEQSHYEAQSETSSGMINRNLPSISGTTGLIPLIGSDTYLEYANMGTFARLNYDFNNKYLFQVNGRNDGSSKFPNGHRYGFFPSVSAGWRISEEKFMKVLKPILNEFKLRGSVGTVGNQNIGDYQFFGGMTSYNPNWLFSGAQVGTLNAPPLVSNSFTWETVKTVDWGFDWGMFNNHFTGTFDWYQRDTKDILTSNPTPLPALLGTGAPLQNAGSLRTNGFELSINWKDKIGKVSYYIGANLFDFTSEVTNAINPSGVITNNTLYTGKKMGEIWGYITDRFYNTTDFVSGSLNANLRNGVLNTGVPKQNGQSPSPGDIVYKDLNGDGLITNGAGTLAAPGDLTIIGNNSLHYQYGINGGLSYKNFDFSFVIIGVGKQDQWISNSLSFPNQFLTYGALYSHQLNYWTPNNLNSFYGRIYTDNVNSSNQSFNQIVQSKFLYDGSFARVKNITARYNFSPELLKKLSINKLQFFCSIENPFLFDHMPQGMQPDVAAGSGSGGLGYPFMKKSSLGINLTF